jgi:hypothetical protein
VEVQQAADRVVATVDEDGLAEVLEPLVDGSAGWSTGGRR